MELKRGQLFKGKGSTAMGRWIPFDALSSHGVYGPCYAQNRSAKTTDAPPHSSSFPLTLTLNSFVVFTCASSYSTKLVSSNIQQLQIKNDALETSP